MRTSVCLILLCAMAGALARPIPRTEQVKDMVSAPLNMCTNFASDQDLQNMGATQRVMDYCTNYFGTRPDAVHVNADGYPYKMCITPGAAEWGNLNPSGGQQVVASDVFNNSMDQPIAHTFDLEGTYAQSLIISTTNTVEFSTSVEFGVELPDIFSLKFTISTSFSSSQTETRTDSNQVSYRSSTSYNVPPHCTFKAALVAETQIYKATMKVPLCLDGYARCQFGSRVQGHYYWYINLSDVVSDSDRCYYQNGVLGSSITVSSNTTTSQTC